MKRIKRKQKPKISAKNKERRLQFAKNYQTWDSEWKAVIFSDEIKFNLDGPDGIQYYWYDSSINEESYSSRASGVGSIMVWGTMSSSGKLKLQEVKGRMKAQDFVSML